MKKIITLIILLNATIASSTTNAQLRYGVTAGANFNDLKFSQDLIGVDSEIGYSAGVFSELMFPGIGFGLDMGLMYTQRGATLHLGDKPVWATDGYGKERAYLHYIEIPINLRFKFHRLNGFEDYCAPFLFAGPSFTILAGHSDIEALDYAGGEVGIQAGFGVELLKKWQISASHNWGTTYALKTKKLDDFSAKNRSWNIKVTYLF